MKAKATMSDSKKPKQPEKTKSTEEKLLDAEALLGEQRLYILYLNFDIEATRREREYWKMKAGGK